MSNLGLRLLRRIRCKHRNSRRSNHKRFISSSVSRGRFELFEDRAMLATTLFLDFGGGIGVGNLLATNFGAIQNVNGAGIGGLGTGPDLIPPYVAGTALNLAPLNYDYDGNSVTNNNDLTALANAVLPLVQRALEPFDIIVQVANSANFANVVATLGANNNDPTGHFDAYSFVLTATSGGISVGTAQGLFGIAAPDDLTAQLGNRQDEVALTFETSF